MKFPRERGGCTVFRFGKGSESRAFRLTPEEFSTRYQIPLGTLRDWEQGLSVPDQTARAYLKVIATNPEGTAEALQKGVA